LYRCETWSLVFWKEHTLRVFEKRVLRRRIVRLKKDEVVGGWRKLHYGKVHNFCASPRYSGDKIKNKMGGACSTHGRDEKCVQNLRWETCGRKKPL
jgi:hypothetical protein